MKEQPLAVVRRYGKLSPDISRTMRVPIQPEEWADYYRLFWVDFNDDVYAKDPGGYDIDVLMLLADGGGRIWCRLLKVSLANDSWAVPATTLMTSSAGNSRSGDSSDQQFADGFRPELASSNRSDVRKLLLS